MIKLINKSRKIILLVLKKTGEQFCDIFLEQDSAIGIWCPVDTVVFQRDCGLLVEWSTIRRSLVRIQALPRLNLSTITILTSGICTG